jgi:uncharacterized protein (TIGR00290 family)
LLSWSSGKDAAWALHLLRRTPGVEVAGLLTTFGESTSRVPIHETPRALVEAQATAAGLPLVAVALPSACPNEVYEDRVRAALGEARDRSGVTHLAFGDLFLADIREYRERLLSGTDVAPLFPIWTSADATPALARTIVDAGFRAVVTCVDTGQLDGGFVGREYDADFLDELPSDADPCGENGEFHTFCYDGPIFERAIRVAPGEARSTERFAAVELREDS